MVDRKEHKMTKRFIIWIAVIYAAIQFSCDLVTLHTQGYYPLNSIVIAPLVGVILYVLYSTRD